MNYKDIAYNGLVAAFVMFLAGFAVVCKINEVNARIDAKKFQNGFYGCEKMIDRANELMNKRQQWKFRSILESQEEK